MCQLQCDFNHICATREIDTSAFLSYTYDRHLQSRRTVDSTRLNTRELISNKRPQGTIEPLLYWGAPRILVVTY
jgi:hypothetical protein